jgi:hypothetical protein
MRALPGALRWLQLYPAERCGFSSNLPETY